MKFSIFNKKNQQSNLIPQLYIFQPNNKELLNSYLAENKQNSTQVLIENILKKDKPVFTANLQVQGNDILQSAVLLLDQQNILKDLQKASKSIINWLKSLDDDNEKKAIINLRFLDAETVHSIVHILSEKIADAYYQYNYLKEKPAEPNLNEILFIAGDSIDLEPTILTCNIRTSAMDFARDLGNSPGNICTPEFLGLEAKHRAEKVGAKVKIFDADEIKNFRMESFLSVAKGSYEPAKLIELTYIGTNADDAPIVLVGKGITFDSGGISLKPGAKMDEMKYDMQGAASVIATFCAAAELKLPINLVAIVPTCENLPSGRANKPGDIVKSMKGLSIEILNTDAEGRLILCDALTYAERFHPKAVIDVATLTGACIVALGHVGSGIMGNDQTLIDDVLDAAVEVDDKAWQLPLWDEYKEQLKSNFADLANIGGPAAGVITAGMFLSYFTEAYPWAHIDIAGTAWRGGDAKGATGRPVPLLLQYLIDAAEKQDV